MKPSAIDTPVFSIHIDRASFTGCAVISFIMSKNVSDNRFLLIGSNNALFQYYSAQFEPNIAYIYPILSRIS